MSKHQESQRKQRQSKRGLQTQKQNMEVVTTNKTRTKTHIKHNKHAKATSEKWENMQSGKSNKH